MATDIPLPPQDARVRLHVYEQFLAHGRPPAAAEAARALSVTAAEVEAAYRRLAEGRALVLRAGSCEILMAMPLSAVPTRFQVEVGGRLYWANCMWDALGLPVMLGRDARISTRCGDCGEPLLVTVERNAVAGGSGWMHVALPASQWWADVEFT